MVKLLDGYIVGEKRFLKLEDITAYKITIELSEYIWKILIKWSIFEKQTIGVQCMSSIDSIGANIAEGFGRYHKKDKEKFYYNARGSVYEASYWIKKANERNLISQEQCSYIMEALRKLPKAINSLIAYTETKLKK